MLIFRMPLRLGTDAYTYSRTLVLMCGDLYENPGATLQSWGLKSDATGTWVHAQTSTSIFKFILRLTSLVMTLNLLFHLEVDTQTCTRSLVLTLSHCFHVEAFIFTWGPWGLPKLHSYLGLRHSNAH